MRWRCVVYGRREGERRPQSNLSGRYNRGVERYSYREEGEARDPIFRSDLEAQPEPPRYEPLRPGGGLWSVVKRLLAPLVAVGLLLVKFKWMTSLCTGKGMSRRRAWPRRLQVVSRATGEVLPSG